MRDDAASDPAPGREPAALRAIADAAVAVGDELDALDHGAGSWDRIAAREREVRAALLDLGPDAERALRSLVDAGLVARWADLARAARAFALLDAASIVATLLDPARRRALLGALAAEHGGRLPIHHAFASAARRAEATPEQLRRVVAALEADGDEDALRAFVWHPAMPEDVLLDLCDRGVCVSELGHRAGPRSLLERVVQRHGYAEAILTLALDLYRDPAAPPDAFAAHARAHATHAWMLRTLAEVDASHPEKEAVYESLLGASVDAAAYHARHLARSAPCPPDRLEAFLAAHPDPWVVTLLLGADVADPEKRALVRRVAEARPDAADIAAALARARACEEARSPGLGEARAAALLEEGDPDVLLALAGNPATPPAVLDALAARKGARLARETRARASATRRRSR